MPIAVYHGPPATRGVRPIWALEELGIPHDIISVDFSAEYRRTPEWRSINPVGKVPTMTDGELTMMESVAMVQYILDRYGGGRPAGAWYPVRVAHYVSQLAVSLFTIHSIHSGCRRHVVSV